MKKIVYLMLLSAALGQGASAATVCGTISKHNICHTLEGCPSYLLSDLSRGSNANSYFIQTRNDSDVALDEVQRYANTGIIVCVTGIVGANGDPDELIVESVNPIQEQQGK